MMFIIAGPREKTALQDILEDTAYVCGISVQDDMVLPEILDGHVIEFQKHRCHDKVETLYYSAQVSDVICIHCSALTHPEWDVKSATCYPVCDNPDCLAQPLVKIRGKNK